MLTVRRLSGLSVAQVPYADPIAMTLLDGVSQPSADLGVFVQQPQGIGFIDPASLAAAYTTIRKISGMLNLGGGGRTGIKTIYQQIPQSMIRVTGGRGVWTDTVTGETMNDLATEVRKVAMMASPLGIFVNHDNWFYDDATGAHTSPDAVLERWNKLFGNGTSFQTAYSKFPELFKVYGPDPANDPIISSVGKVEQTAPLPPDQRSGYAAGLLTTATGITPTGSTPTGSTPTTHPPTAMAGLSGGAIAAIVAGVVVLALVTGKRRA